MIGYYTAAERGFLLRGVVPVSVAEGMTIAAGGTQVLRPSGVEGIPSSGVTALGLALTARGAANGTIEVVSPDEAAGVRAVAYAADKDTAGFVTAALRPDGSIVLKNTGTTQAALSATVYAYFETG
ncbi:hypothetical protein [Nonomuraea sp. NPDC050202]|uniref:hypothetical protein n=1 Tax=Nonomuraea sp. NPDC050202 TaxID=3155035 RepID=UPI0033F41E35